MRVTGWDVVKAWAGVLAGVVVGTGFCAMVALSVYLWMTS